MNLFLEQLRRRDLLQAAYRWMRCLYGKYTGAFRKRMTKPKLAVKKWNMENSLVETGFSMIACIAQALIQLHATMIHV